MCFYVDHFNYQETRKFPMRYLINDDHFDGSGPMFFYTGNEGPIDLFTNNTGFMWDIAEEYKAILLFGEHRYYGETMPFGLDSYKDGAHLQWLTSEQALADFALLIKEVKAQYGMSDANKVVTFGGSYGGMVGDNIHPAAANHSSSMTLLK